MGAIIVALAVASATRAMAADNPAEVFELPSVEVIGITPLPGLGIALRNVPANVQRFGGRDIGRQRQPTLTQFLEQNANSVSAASGQGNPYQQSLDFRGSTASPLLGAPQGISVFQDGVRINEAFGDVVNWDLLPRSAISSVQLLPGSMPAFGQTLCCLEWRIGCMARKYDRGTVFGKAYSDRFADTSACTRDNGDTLVQ